MKSDQIFLLTCNFIRSVFHAEYIIQNKYSNHSEEHHALDLFQITKSNRYTNFLRSDKELEKSCVTRGRPIVVANVL